MSDRENDEPERPKERKTWEELHRRLVAGDEQAVAQLYGLLRRQCAHLSLSKDSQEEVLQEAICRILAANREAWDRVQNLRAYCRKVVRNTILSRQPSYTAVGAGSGVLGQEPSPEWAAMAKELHACLSLLKAQDVEIIRLIDLEQRTVPEVTRLFRSQNRPATISAMETRIRRARFRLQAILSARGFDSLTLALVVSGFLGGAPRGPAEKAALADSGTASPVTRRDE